jgi:hypothetical protein
LVRTISKLTMSAAVAAALALTGAACSSSSSSTTGAASTASETTSSGCQIGTPTSGVVGLQGFRVCLFAAATTTANHPDSIVVSGGDVFVGYQNITAKDGTDTKTSTIAEYTTHGKLLKSWSILGHNDGLRMDPATHVLWAMCDEDGNPRLFTIDPSVSGASAIKQYTLPKTPHGGGFDDIQFINGLSLIDASNPTLNAAGKNVFPALYKVQLSGTTASLTPVLMADAKATTINTPVSTVTLNLTDPDSMMIDPQGNLVLDSQGDSEMLFIQHVGTPQQKVSVLTVGTQVDDTVFPSTAKGCVLVADNNSGVYSICSSVWVPGTPYTAAPNDSTVIGFIGTISMSNGAITPIVVGIANPHGMAFIPQ